MIQFEGEKQLPYSPARLYARLTDPNFLLTCLPDLDRIEQVESRSATFILRPGFSFVRGTLHTRLTILETVPDAEAGFRLESRGIGSSSTVVVALALSATGQETLLHYTAQVTELGGLLKLVPSGLVRGAAQKVVGDVLAAVEKNLAAAAEPVASDAPASDNTVRPT